MKWLWTRAKCDPMGFKYFFSKNLQKSPSGWGLCPQTPIAIGSCGLCPQTPVSDTFEYTSLLNTSSKLDFYTFQQLVFALSLYQNPGKVPSGYGFRSSILRYLCPTKNYFFENFWWRHCVWFVVWAPPPNQKSWLRLWFGLRILWIEYDANVHDFKIDITSVIGRRLDDLLLIRFRGVNFGCKIWCLKLEPLNFRYL